MIQPPSQQQLAVTVGAKVNHLLLLRKGYWAHCGKFSPANLNRRKIRFLRVPIFFTIKPEKVATFVLSYLHRQPKWAK